MSVWLIAAAGLVSIVNPEAAAAEDDVVFSVVEIEADTTAATPPTNNLVVDLEVPWRLLQMIDRGTTTDEELVSWVSLPGNREVLERGVPAAHLRDNARAVVTGVATDLRQPLGRPGTVRMEPLEGWRRSLAWLALHADSLAARAASHVQHYVAPEDGPERINIYFHLAGGWDARTTDAIYVNLTRLLDTPEPDLEGVDALLVRELVQVYVANRASDFVDFSSPDAALLTGLQQLVSEGLVRFVERRALCSVYPEGTRAAQVVQDYAASDRQLPELMRDLDRFTAEALRGHAAAAESLLVEGLRTGAFPAIGDLICRTLYAHGGAAALAAYPQCGPAAILRDYQAVAVTRDDLPDLPIAMSAQLETLAAGLERTWLLVDAGRRQAFAALDVQDFRAALAPLRQINELMPGGPVDTYNLACVLAMLRETDEAMQVLEQAVSFGFRNLEHIRNDPDLQPLHELPAFQELLRRLGGDAGDGATGG